jgi:Leucine-rich repeat (LRR) protein
MDRLVIYGSIVVAAVATATAASGQVPASERQALIDLHAALGGPSWIDDAGWLGPPGTECTWFGIECSEPPSRVAGIELGGNGLRGALPDVFGVLPSLETLYLNGNDFSGTFPPSLATLGALRDLSLGDHEGDGQLTGVLPDLSALLQLERLDLQGQDLEGPLPDLSAFPSLQEVTLSSNRFTGSIPSLAGLDNLVSLDLRDNQLTGPIPAELSQLTSLEQLDLSNNREVILEVAQRCVGPFASGLGGEIPDLRALQSLRLLVLGGNLFEGAFPRVGGLRELEFFDIGDNCLEGGLPGDVISTLSGVAWFLVGGNDFAGQIPAEIGTLPSLTEQLDLSNNRFVGSFPDLSGLTGLKRLFLHGNALRGEIPESILATSIILDDPDLYCEQCLSLDYNGLSARAASAELRAWLSARAGAWELTQTVAPTRVRVIPRDESSVIVAWRPIEFRGFAGEVGRYVVSLASSADGPFQVVGDTDDPELGEGKEVNQLLVEGLGAGARHFRVETESDPHPWNQNPLRSLPSAVAAGSAGTLAVEAGAEQDVGGQGATQSAVATSSSGARAVVWSEAGSGVLGRIFPKNGAAGDVFLVADDPGAETPSASWTGTGPEERLVVAWISGGGVPAVAGGSSAGFDRRAASAQGSVLGRTFTVGGGGAEPEETLDLSDGGAGSEPAVSGSPSGHTVVVWQAAGGVLGRKLSGGGPDAPFPVDDGAGGANPAVAAAADGSFVVVWEGPDGVAGRMFDAAGQPRPVEVPQAGAGGIGQPRLEPRLRLTEESTARNPAITRSGNGDFVVAWDGDGDGRDVFGRVFERGGLPISAILELNEETPGDQVAPSVRANFDGDFVVTWTSEGAAAAGRPAASVVRQAGGVLGRHFDPGGVPQGDELPLADPPGGAGSSQPDVTIDDEDRGTVVFTRRRAAGQGDAVFQRDFEAERPAQPRECAPDDQTLCVSSSRFEVTATWQDADGESGEANGVALSSDTGYFWFFDAANVELVVKVLDGCAVNGRFWVFAGGLTDVQVDLQVHDTRAGRSRRYFNAVGRPFRPVQDTAAFETCDVAAGAPEPDGVAALAREALADVEQLSRAATSSAASAADCATAGSTLCVNANRFAVTVEWRSPSGASGVGQAAQLTSDTGYFWFFDAANVELVIKVLDACVLNERFWVFAGGLTDVEALVTVTDTLTGSARSYTNALGAPFQPIQDTSAFDTCP